MQKYCASVSTSTSIQVSVQDTCASYKEELKQVGGLFPNKVSMVKLMNLTQCFLMRWELQSSLWSQMNKAKVHQNNQAGIHSINSAFLKFSKMVCPLCFTAHFLCFFFVVVVVFLAQRAIQSKTKPGQSIDYIRNTTALIFSPQVTEEIFREWGDLKNGEE